MNNFKLEVFTDYVCPVKKLKQVYEIDIEFVHFSSSSRNSNRRKEIVRSFQIISKRY